MLHLGELESDQFNSDLCFQSQMNVLMHKQQHFTTN